MISSAVYDLVILHLFLLIDATFPRKTVIFSDCYVHLYISGDNIDLKFMYILNFLKKFILIDGEKSNSQVMFSTDGCMFPESFYLG